MNKIIPIAASLLLAACATSQQQSSSATSQLGTVTDKQTFIQQAKNYRSPIDVGIGIAGGGHVGWGINLGLNTLLNLAQGTASETVYQYKIKTGASESLTLQSKQDFAVGSCLNVLTLAGDSNYPKITACTP